MKTLQLLKDYASTIENTWLSKELETLEIDIQHELNKEYDLGFVHGLRS